MDKPYIICHMMMSLDARIDCDMTIDIPGNNVYYDTLNSLDAPSRISGKVTAATELTNGKLFRAKNSEVIGHQSFKVNANAHSYEIVTDTRGTLTWGDDHNSSKPHLILMSENAPKEYTDYLNERGISWIATGKKRIDLVHAMEILTKEFGVERVAVVGGGKINGGFLEAGLIDEISVVIGPAVDGRINQPSLFDGRRESKNPIQLKLKDVKKYDNGAIWLRYLTE
ncbi:dihydrofolate reductase family protein [Lactobacillus sp.]|uniref:dihydrofolate reductase family protein n=1 Tax=Lactobacillus sp. TaxID=1591 RepID=UPI0019C32DB9|nr:dihydrofolate reductase family protein [Lactobacillus sp.]MBD5429676.1 deaminase [Lactobacillus sp.]MBD5430553.1 deaminase [Lactobacillus sp.]